MGYYEDLKGLSIEEKRDRIREYISIRCLDFRLDLFHEDIKDYWKNRALEAEAKLNEKSCDSCGCDQ